MTGQQQGEPVRRRRPATISQQLLLVLIGVNMLVTLVASVGFYVQHRSWLLEGLDAKLAAVATMARENLPPDYHDRIVGPESVSDAEFQRLVERNNRLCELLGLEYIWSLMVVDGQIVFTSSTSPDKVAANRRHAAFFEPHSNPELYASTFASLQETHQSSHDKWGDIRVALIPGVDQQGRKFLFGASVRLAEVRRQLLVLIWEAVGLGLVVFVLSMAVSWWVARLVTTPLQRLTKTICEIAAGHSQIEAEEHGSYEQVELAICFNRMNRTLQDKIADLERMQARLISEHSAEIEEAEESRLMSEQRCRGLLDFAVDGILIGNPDGYVTEANQRMCELFDRPREEILGRHITTMPFTPASLQANPFRFDLVGKGEMVVTERVVRRRDGSEIVVEMHTKMMPDGSYQSIYHDISERKLAETEIRLVNERLTRQYALLDALLQNLTVGVLMAEAPSGMPLVVNQAACRLLGRGVLPDADASNLAERYRAYRAADRTPYPIDQMPIVLATQGISSQVDDMLVKRPDGSEVLLEVFGTPVKDEQGRVWASLVSFTDITERRRAQELLESWNVTLEEQVKKRTAEVGHYAKQLQSLTGKLLRAEEDERRRLSYVLHEDLQQLLVAARMTLDSARQHPASQAGGETLARADSILQQSLRLTRSIVQDISVPAIREGDLGTAVGWLAQQAKEKFELTVTLSAAADLPILGEEIYLCLYRAVQELLFNVAKHSGVREAAVAVRRLPAGGIEVTVSDRGCGLKQPLATNGTPENDGGFGLFSIRERLEALGGTMTVDSLEGGGLAVVLSIPVVPESMTNS